MVPYALYRLGIRFNFINTVYQKKALQKRWKQEHFCFRKNTFLCVTPPDHMGVYLSQLKMEAYDIRFLLSMKLYHTRNISSA